MVKGTEPTIIRQFSDNYRNILRFQIIVHHHGAIFQLVELGREGGDRKRS